MVFMFRFIEFRNPEENQRRKLQRYAFRELKAATDNFSSKNIVGKGGFGKVFKGQLGDGSFIAIKRISALTTDARLRVCREAEISTMIMHQNLVSLIGICMRWNEILLVYPLVSKGSVARCLRELHPPLDWQTRRRIALGVARGLAHLHDDCKILHRDVKTENVLLDERFEPAITDFGLSQLLDQNTNSVQPPPTLSPERSASGFIRSLRIFKSKKPDGSTRQLTLAEELLKKHKWRSQFANQWQWKRNKPKSKKTNWPLERSMPLRPARGEDSADRTPSLDRELLPDWSRRSTGICGTIGYIAPESIATGMRTYKHDVYGYGVTLLELISGGRVFSLTWPSKGIFAFQDWVKQLLKDTEVETLVDPRLQGNYIVDEVKQLIMLAQMCLQYSPNERPKMSEVVTMLEGNGLVERWEEWQNGRLSCEDNRAQGLNNGSETESTSYYSLSPPDESFVQ